MHIHILGICGTFMAGLALLAREAGHRVSGSDANVYPPMSTQLADAGIAVREGYNPEQLRPDPDLVVVGNAMTRGNPAVEYLLDSTLPFTSGPQWLAEQVLRERWVLAVAGTHGKTTTSAMLAWILDRCGLAPGFLIGGLPVDFPHSARLGDGLPFVVEADEYDSAFFDKRAKFVHYRPRTAVLNNLEFDHADIYPDLAAIQRQFHHLVRIVPGSGLIVSNGADTHLEAVLAQGCWTPVQRFEHGEWRAEVLAADGNAFEVLHHDRPLGRVTWQQLGRHNVANALAAIVAAHHAGVPAQEAIRVLADFGGVRRRLEHYGSAAGVALYDDFAHHPTAVATTLAGLRARVGKSRIFAVLEPRSNSMRLGVFRDRLAPALAAADAVLFYQPPGLDWNLDSVAAACHGRIFGSVEQLIDTLRGELHAGDQVLIMSNGGFDGLHGKLLKALQARTEPGT